MRCRNCGTQLTRYTYYAEPFNVQQFPQSNEFKNLCIHQPSTDEAEYLVPAQVIAREFHEALTRINGDSDVSWGSPCQAWVRAFQSLLVRGVIHE